MKKAFLFLLTSLILASTVLAASVTIGPDGMGAYNSWTNQGRTAATEWQCVNEATANTSDYVYTNGKNTKESFSYSNSGQSGYTINSVTLYYYAKYYSSSKYKIQPMIRSGGTNYLGNTLTLTSGYASYNQQYNTNPATGSAWTWAQVDALEAGMNSYNSNNGGGYVAQTYAVVAYTIPDSCSDTDGGNNIVILGTTSGIKNEASYSDTDYCVDSSNVFEYYCSGTQETSQQQSCGTDGYGSNYCLGNAVYHNYTDYSCNAGACAHTHTPELVQTCGADQYCYYGTCRYSDTCSDTDGGDVPLVFGTVSGYAYGYPYSVDDKCMGDSNLNETYCYGTQKAIHFQSCGTDAYGSAYCSDDDVYKDYTDYYCSGGVCDSDTTPELQQDCGTDGYGANFCVGTQVYHNYTDNYCSSGACGYSITPELVETCLTGQYCSSGACHWTNSCSDTDGGVMPNIFGTVSGYYSDASYSYDDFCNTSAQLKEYWCNGALAKLSSQTCSYGCADGKCNPAPDSCTDTDGGIVPLIGGNTYGYYQGNFYYNPDLCLNGTASMMTEWYCSGTSSNSQDIDCNSNGTTYCTQGHCA
ncbi:MAG: hypothetical protein V1837_05245 [Candidatus Woesearchaeota archaeon]